MLKKSKAKWVLWEETSEICRQSCPFLTGPQLKSSSSICLLSVVVELPRFKIRPVRPGIGRGRSRMVEAEVGYHAPDSHFRCCLTRQRRWWTILRRWDGFASTRYFFDLLFGGLPWRILVHSQSYHVSPLLILVHKKRNVLDELLILSAFNLCAIFSISEGKMMEILQWNFFWNRLKYLLKRYLFVPIELQYQPISSC